MNGRQDKGAHHGNAVVHVLIYEAFDGQQVHDAHGHGNTAGKHANEVPEGRPDHGHPGPQGVGVNDRGDGVGRVVEAIDKLERAGCHQANHQKQQHMRL